MCRHPNLKLNTGVFNPKNYAKMVCKFKFDYFVQVTVIFELDQKFKSKTCRTQAPNPKPHPNIRLIHEDRPKINQEWFIEIVRPCLALKNHFLAASKCPLSLGRHSLASRKHYLAPRKCLSSTQDKLPGTN